MKFLFVIALFIYMRSSNTFNDTNLKLSDREDTIPTNKCLVFLNSIKKKCYYVFFRNCLNCSPSYPQVK